MTPSLGLSASKTLRHSFSATNLFLRKQLWVWPLLAALMLGGIGYMLRTRVENSIKESMAAQLTAILDTDVEAMRIWLDVQKKNAETAAGAVRIVELSRRILPLSEKSGPAGELIAAPEMGELRTAIAPWTKAHGYTDFILVDSKLRFAAGAFDELVGKQAGPRYVAFLKPVLAGRSVVSTPFPSIVALKDSEGQMRAGVPTMFAAAPIRGADDQIIGAIGFRLRPEVDFTQILNVAKFGESGETYAFDESGLLLSRSRFDDDLKRLGLIPDRADAQSVLTLELKDPLSDMTQGKPALKRRSELGLTRMAADAVQGRSGVDAEGYRDYRGVPVIGAWKWLPDYGFGVATEVDVAEAYRPSQILRVAFWGLFALLAISAVAIFAFTLVVARLQRSMRHAALTAKKLGQYTLEEQIGQGGMGSVYRGRHAMLRRPTAIKLLDVDKTTVETIRRFEREVQLTSQLHHPNTIAVFDFGHTPEGVFYYAMEFLDGINLERLVQLYGPQGEGRVIHILLQICGSLNEAHGIGLIHRDIKPANIVLNERGGQHDVVKLLDFGLVKAAHAENQLTLTVANSITGTPLYLSPEAIEHPEDVDAKSDLYAVGAVGYYLLTGTTVFTGKSLVEVCMHQVNTPPEPPSQRLGRAVSSELEAILLKCLAKNPADRPASAKELAAALRACPMADAWSDADAENWWRDYSAATPQVSSSPTTETAKQGATAVWTKDSVV